MTVRRKRIIYLCLILLVIFAGLASRKFSLHLPGFIADYSGDTLWGLMVFLITGFFFPANTIMKSALIAISFCFVIELSQLYQADWINNIRHTKAGGLILGYGFLWSDLLCYAAGVMIGVILEKVFLKDDIGRD